jgi:hypothetical protein
MQYILASVSYYSLYVPLFRFYVRICDIQVPKAFKEVRADLEALEDLLESIEHFLKRLDIYTKVPPTPAMTEVVVKIMVELLSTLALATKQIRKGPASESVFAGVFLDSMMQCREICEQAFRREWHQCGSSEAGPPYPG